MRLTRDQIAEIRRAVAETFGAEARVWLFGSRVDNNKRGGDIDLLIRPDPANADRPLLRKIHLLGKLEKALGERKIDVVVEHSGDSRPIVRIAHETGIRL